MVLVVHLPIVHLMVQLLGFPGAAWAFCLSGLINLVLIWTFVGLAGFGPRVWGKPSKAAFKVCTHRSCSAQGRALAWEPAIMCFH